MLKKIIVVGDVHLREKEPYYSQALNILDSIFYSEVLNNENNILVLLGDLVERINSTFELAQVYVDFFLNKSKFKKIKILQGNHDCALLRDSYGNITHSTVLSVLKPLPNVEIIDDWKLETPSEEVPMTLLFLPHYDHEGTSKLSIFDAYSNLDIKENIDFAFTHVEDETNHFGSKFCDLSKLKVKQYLNGHIHTENLSTGGRFLGSPGFNSSSEASKTPYFAVIDVASKKHELIPVVKYIEYMEVTYPNALPKVTAKYPIFTVHDSIDKEETLNLYTKQATEKGYEFYCRKVFSKKVKNDALTMSESENSNKSITEHFTDYAQSNKVLDQIKDICMSVLTKV